MSTPHERDPQKPSPFIIDEATNPYAMNAKARAHFDSIVTRISRLETTARAVVSAGRPDCAGYHARPGPEAPCRCDQCAAWDALKALLNHEHTTAKP